MAKQFEDKKYIEKQKTALLKEKIKIEKELKEIEKFPSYGDKEEENAMEVEQFEGSLGLRKGAKDLKKQIDKALKKIEKGTYGMCEVCKGPIERGRLDAYPAADKCVEHSKK